MIYDIIIRRYFTSVPIHLEPPFQMPQGHMFHVCRIKYIVTCFHLLCYYASQSQKLSNLLRIMLGSCCCSEKVDHVYIHMTRTCPCAGTGPCFEQLADMKFIEKDSVQCCRYSLYNLYIQVLCFGFA